MPSSTSEGEGGSAGRERQGGGFRRAASGRSQPCRQPDLQLTRPVRDLSPLVCKIINLCGFKPLHLWQFFTAAIGNYPPPSSPIHPATMSSVSYLVTCPRVSRMWVRWCRGTTELVILHRVLPTCGPARCGPAIPSDPLESWNRAHLTASRPVLRGLCVFGGGGAGHTGREGRTGPAAGPPASVPDSRQCTPRPPPSLSRGPCQALRGLRSPGEGRSGLHPHLTTPPSGLGGLFLSRLLF